MSHVENAVRTARHVWRVVNERRKSLLGASYLAAQPLLLNAISIPVTAYIIASLGPQGYGEWSVALSLVASTSGLSNIGLRSAFIRAVSRDREQAPASFAEQLGLRIALSFVTGFIAVIACVMLGYPATVLQCTLILSVAGIAGAAGTVVADLLTVVERMASVAAINLTAGLSLTAASVVAIWFGAGPLGLGCAYALGPIVTAVMSLMLVQRDLFPVRVSRNPARWWELIKESKVLGLQQFAGSLDAQVANLLTPKLVGISEYGYFAAGTLLPSRLLIVPDALATAFYPQLCKSHSEGAGAFRPVVKLFGLLNVLAGLAVAVPVFFLAGPISTLLFDERADLCRIIIQVTIWIVPLVSLWGGASYVLNAAFRERAETKVSLIAMILSAIVTIPLIAQFGLMGASAALIVKGLVNLVVRLPILRATMQSPTRA